MARACGWNSKAIADEVAEALQLGEDLIINEVRTSESRREALQRLKLLQEDVVLALDIVLRAKGGR